MLTKYKSDSYLCGELDKYAFKALISLKINWIYQAKSDPKIYINVSSFFILLLMLIEGMQLYKQLGT